MNMRIVLLCFLLASCKLKCEDSRGVFEDDNGNWIKIDCSYHFTSSKSLPDANNGVHPPEQGANITFSNGRIFDVSKKLNLIHYTDGTRYCYVSWFYDKGYLSNGNTKYYRKDCDCK
jgi:hypothetical protein